MGIRFSCPNGHKLNVKSFLAGKRAICPKCGTRVTVPDLPEAGDVETSSDVEPSVRPEVDVPPLLPPSIETPAPSVVLPLADSPPPIVSSETAAVIPGSIDGAPSSTPDNVEAAAMAATSIYQLRQARRRRSQLQIALGLLIVVLLLAITLVWVLTRSVTPSAPTAPNANTTSQVLRQDRGLRHPLIDVYRCTPLRLEGSC